MKTRLFTVHLLDNASDSGLVLVKDGFSWPAFFMTLPWALFHRMWWIAGAFAALHIVVGLGMTAASFSYMQQGVVSFAIALAVGFSADELRCGHLRRRGFAFEDVVIAENSDRATRRFLDARPDIATRLAGVRP